MRLPHLPKSRHELLKSPRQLVRPRIITVFHAKALHQNRPSLKSDAVIIRPRSPIRNPPPFPSLNPQRSPTMLAHTSTACSGGGLTGTAVGGESSELQANGLSSLRPFFAFPPNSFRASPVPILPKLRSKHTRKPLFNKIKSLLSRHPREHLSFHTALRTDS
jgi:hypothetical protein